MAKINVKLTTGDEFTISEAFHGASGPMNVREAQIQMSFILGSYAAIQTDQGVTINVAQIAYEWVS